MKSFINKIIGLAGSKASVVLLYALSSILLPPELCASAFDHINQNATSDARFESMGIERIAERGRWERFSSDTPRQDCVPVPRSRAAAKLRHFVRCSLGLHLLL